MTGGAAAAAGSAAYAGLGLRGRQRLCVLLRSGPRLSNIDPHLEKYWLRRAANAAIISLPDGHAGAVLP